jgi:acylphosphatase
MSTDPEGTSTRGFRVTGRVQGVGFRHWTRKTAERLGLSGTVRNLPDGSVEVHAAGSAHALRELEGALRDGPPGARVEQVDAVPARVDLPRGGFRIDH